MPPQLTREWTPVQMLFLLALLVFFLLGFVIVVASIQGTLDLVFPIVSVLATAFSGIIGGIILFIKLSKPEDKT